ncbi:MAG: hypothetical protein ACREXR_07650 [Gammaproteobacteria bacterium]
MPRKPRMYLFGLPAHVVQRGNNRYGLNCAFNGYAAMARDKKSSRGPEGSSETGFLHPR